MLYIVLSISDLSQHILRAQDLMVLLKQSIGGDLMPVLTTPTDNVPKCSTHRLHQNSSETIWHAVSFPQLCHIGFATWLRCWWHIMCIVLEAC